MHRGNAVKALLVVLPTLIATTPFIHAQGRRIDPTWLYRNTAAVAAKPLEMTTPTCGYKPMFGQGDAESFAVVGVARYGEAIVKPHGVCARILRPEEDQIYVVLKGNGSVEYGGQNVPLKTEDYIYLPATVPHTLHNSSGTPMTVVVMGFWTKGYKPAPLPAHPLKSNIEDVPTTFVNGHPHSTRYRLLMGDMNEKRDQFDAGRVMISLFYMEIAPGGTNFPHHHERAEEIYLILSGHGTIVAGGGMNGIAGRHPAKAGDAYFFRLNSTVGYYSAPNVASRLLCVRSWYPGMALPGR